MSTVNTHMGTTLIASDTGAILTTKEGTDDRTMGNDTRGNALAVHIVPQLDEQDILRHRTGHNLQDLAIYGH